MSMQFSVGPPPLPEQRMFAVPGHCVDINGDPWHAIGECTDPQCQRKSGSVPRTTCCGYERIKGPTEDPRPYKKKV